jgi:hypothetical protein
VLRNLGRIAPRGQPTGSSQGVREVDATFLVAAFFCVPALAVTFFAAGFLTAGFLPAVFVVAVFLAAVFAAAVFFAAPFFAAVFVVVVFLEAAAVVSAVLAATFFVATFFVAGLFAVPVAKPVAFVEVVFDSCLTVRFRGDVLVEFDDDCAGVGLVGEEATLFTCFLAMVYSG